MRVNKSFTRLRTGLLAGLLLSIVATGSVMAAEPTMTPPESITLSPVSKLYKVDAGSTHTDKLTIVNDGATDYNFTVYTAPYSVKDEGYDPDFTSIRTNTDIESWVQFEKTTYFAKAGSTVTVDYKFVVPENAFPGGHYGVIFAETQPAGNLDSTGVERKKRVGAIIYATVNGEYKTGGQVLIIDTPKFQFTSPLKSSLTIENTGNADFTAKTSYLVTDVFGNKKYQTEKTFQILPQTSRKMPLEWAQAPSFGLFKATVATQFLDKNEVRSNYVLMAPVWMYLVLASGLLLGVVYLVQRKR